MSKTSISLNDLPPGKVQMADGRIVDRSSLYIKKNGNETQPTKPTQTKEEKRKDNFKKAATIVSGLSDLAGRLKDPGLNYTPSATSVKSGASRGASYINSFDEYDTEKGGVNG